MSTSHNNQNGNSSSNIDAIHDTTTSNEMIPHATFVPPNSMLVINENQSLHQQNSMQPMMNLAYSPVAMVEHSFYYRPCNDFQIYLVNCKRITISKLISELNNHLSSSHNCIYSNNLFVFYFQHPNDQRIYQVACEMISHSIIVQYLNLNVFGFELKQSEQQQQLEFSKIHKQNLEFHLRQFLIDYLP